MKHEVIVFISITHIIFTILSVCGILIIKHKSKEFVLYLKDNNLENNLPEDVLDYCDLWCCIYAQAKNKSKKYAYFFPFLPIFNIRQVIVCFFYFAILTREYSDVKEEQQNIKTKNNIINKEKLNMDIKNNIKKYLDNKTQYNEQKIIEKALNNNNNPYFTVIFENAKIINELILSYEKKDYFLNPKRSLNFDNSINDTIMNFIKVIELIDDLNIKTDMTSMNLNLYNEYLYDLKTKLSGGIN